MRLLEPAFATINLAYVALLVAAFCTSMVRVRILLVAGAAFFVAYGTIQGVTSMIVWNVVIGGLNLQRLTTELWARAAVMMTAEQETIRRRLFPDLTPREFQQLWNLGEDLLCVDRQLIEAGVVPDRVHLLLRGTVHIVQGGALLQALGPGAMIGKPRTSPFATPSTECRAAGAAWLRSWDRDDLADVDLRKPVDKVLSQRLDASVGIAA